ncbi:Regulator of nonsense transcripts 3A like protein [Argiope bruennichi]|uniref:Regulator of nonsense transcripts 3A like protein n=1 Tax=Argiope bruennichi TaxID=94029 RepID=A0A8T0FMV6_ARGBR|nr:Regulator of nonsense transcripts 3A like protein [Argiope bruennichi]
MSTIGNKARDNSTLKIKCLSSDDYKSKMKRDKTFQTKVVIRRLPPTMSEEQFLEQISPVPEHDYMYFVKADMSLGPHAFSRAYINFLIPGDIFLFKDKFDGYVFLDSKGNEYPAIVEFAPFQKIPKKRNPKKRDTKCGTIDNDPDYLKFLESLKNPDEVALPSAEVYLEEIECREKELKANNGVPKVTTPLIEYLTAKKIEQQVCMQGGGHTVFDESKKATIVQVLKNPEREKDQKEVTATTPQKSKEYFVSSRVSKDKDRNKKEWERIRTKERQKAPARSYFSDKDRSRRDKTDYKLYGNKKSSSDSSSQKQKEETKESELNSEELSKSVEESKEDSKIDLNVSTNSQWSSKDKRDNSCPGNVETPGSQKDKSELSCKSFKNSSKSVSGDEVSNMNEISKSDSNASDQKDRGKDPRTERRIRNKDRPSIEIYRPGMRRFSAQRSSPQKEISTSASNSSSPSPTPPLIGAVQGQVKKEADNKTSSA